jgi:hypothetical protein
MTKILSMSKSRSYGGLSRQQNKNIYVVGVILILVPATKQ